MITPISLESDITVVKRQLEVVREMGITRFHIDIIDGLFADNVTVSPADLQELDFAGVDIDLHLLVDDPVEWVEECVALKPARIFAQIERMGNIEYYVETLKGYGSRVGIGLDLYTPVGAIEDQVLSKVDCVLLMSVKAGFSGQEFNEKVITKIGELRQRFAGEIFVDGGITPDSYRRVLAAGANSAGANTAIWSGDFAKNLAKFNKVED